jgi:nucleotide-binding universal stress UspA family protein
MGVTGMKFPIFYGFFTPDIATKDSFGPMSTALDLAQRLDGQLSVAIGKLKITVPNVMVSATVDGLIASENKRRAKSAADSQQKVVELARGSGVIIHTEIVEDDFIGIKRRFANRARIHGLVFAESGLPGEIYNDELIEPLLFESGRPVLIVPKGFASSVSLDHILIAWDGSANAARAVWDSIPLLEKSKKIEIVTVMGEKNIDTAPAADTLAPMLTYLNENIRVTALEIGDQTAAGAIKKHAKMIGAGLVIQGAYGRSRWTEMVLGGVTREMLRDSDLPVLMSH